MMFDRIATGIMDNIKIAFLGKDAGIRYANSIPTTKNDRMDRSPLQGLPTTRFPPGTKILKPSLSMGTPSIRTIDDPSFTATNFNGKEMAVMTASGKGNIRIMYPNGKASSFAISFPNKNSVAPMINK